MEGGPCLLGCCWQMEHTSCLCSAAFDLCGKPVASCPDVAAWTWVGARGGTREPSSITSSPTSPKTGTGCYCWVACPLEEDGPCPNTPLFLLSTRR